MEKRILKRIEALRKKLNQSGVNNNLLDKEVIELSQQLDLLLNQYYRIMKYEQLSFW